MPYTEAHRYFIKDYCVVTQQILYEISNDDVDFVLDSKKESIYKSGAPSLVSSRGDVIPWLGISSFTLGKQSLFRHIAPPIFINRQPLVTA